MKRETRDRREKDAQAGGRTRTGAVEVARNPSMGLILPSLLALTILQSGPIRNNNQNPKLTNRQLRSYYPRHAKQSEYN